MSKRRPFRDESTGPEAAQKYMTEHLVQSGAHGSLKKLDRAARIHNGLRPLKYGRKPLSPFGGVV